MKEITVKAFKERLDKGEDIQIIDVREPYEYDIVNLGGELIPMGELFRSTDKIARDKTVVFHCRSGNRSAQAVKLLEKKEGLDNLYNLKGGILAYANEVDQDLPTY